MRRTVTTIHGPRTLRANHKELTALHSDEILVGVEYSGVCGSDLHFFEAGTATPGTPFGHEIVGTVLEAAPAHSDLIGSRVVVNPYVFCGRCRHCMSERPINCTHRRQSFDTGFATHVHVTVAPDAANVFVVPEGLLPAVAALAEPASVAIHAAARALRHAGADGHADSEETESPLLVLGAGPIGLLLSLYLTQSLAKRVWVLDRSAERRTLATAAGAEQAYGSAEKLSEALAALPDQDAPIAGSGPLPPVSVVFECSGAGVLLAQAAHAWVGRGGVLCQVAVFGNETTLSVDSLLRKEADLVTSYAYTHEDWHVALEFLSAHRNLAAVLVTEHHGLDNLESLLTATADGQIAHKPVVRVAP